MLVEAPIFHTNRYPAGARYAHLAGVIRHEEWCIMRNERAFYEYEVAIEPCEVDYADRSILHGPGVNCSSTECSPSLHFLP